MVLYVADDRRRESLEGFYGELDSAACAALEVVVRHMGVPYIEATREHVPEAEQRIAYDQFHVAKHPGEAVDPARRREDRDPRSEGHDRLVKPQYLWLQHPDHLTRRQWQEAGPLRSTRLKVARPWAIKEAAMELWGYVRRGWAARLWERRNEWAIPSRLEPVKRREIKVPDTHLSTILPWLPRQQHLIHGK